MGFAMVGLVPGTQSGIYGVLIYMAIYLAMTLGTFAALLSMRIGDRYVETIADLAGLSRNNGVMAFFIAMMMLSLAGIPPLAGFFAKLYVFQPAVEAGFYWLAVIGVLLSVVSTFYYLRIVKVIYFDAPAERFSPVQREVTGVLWASSFVILLFWIYPAPVLNAASVAARSLF